MTKLYKEVDALLKRIEKAAALKEIKKDEIMFLAGMLSGAGMRLANRYQVSSN